MVLQVLVAESSPASSLFFQPGMSDITGLRSIVWSSKRQACRHWVLAECLQDLAHRPVQIDLDHLATEVFMRDVWQILRWIGLELFEKDPISGDLAKDPTIG